MHHQHAGLPRSEALDGLTRGGHDALRDLVDRLGPGSLHVGVGVEGEGGVLAESFGELLARQAGAHAHVVLAQAGILLGRQPRGLLQEGGCLPGASEVTADQQRWVHLGDDGGHLLGLLASGVVEADVGVALRPSGGVPGGLAVPHQEEPPAGAGVSGPGRR